MKRIDKKYIFTAVLLVLVAVIGVWRFLSHTQEKQFDSINEDTISSWDVETMSFKEYASYEEAEKEWEKKRKKTLDEYNKAIQGTIVEQVQNSSIPSYGEGDTLVQLQNGSIEVPYPKDLRFPDESFVWSTSLNKTARSFTVGDFNQDGLPDVAHVVTETSGGSGRFYHLVIFINEKGTLKYLTREYLGDRVFIKSVKYDSGVFTVDLITQGEGDDFMGYCCANVPATMRYKLEDNMLVKM